MSYVNINPGINPGIKSGMRQPYTIMLGDRIFFLTHDEQSGDISWNMFMEDPDLKKKIEKTLKSYLTNR